ncbi:MAG: hypothetical protein M3Y09_17850 [Actinomycetota bacterium]|nr:hypothetical protein [Actinomycetota bacterium]
MSRSARRMIDAPAPAVSYPSERKADVALRDGSTVHVRPVRAADETAIRTTT